MILSASRRTDIPAFYSKWLVNRFKAGYVYVRNPFNHTHITKIELNPETIDCIVFWTKNPEPLIEKIDQFKDYNYYFQISINPYNASIERGLPKKRDILQSVRKLSSLVGKERIVWRYDPVLLTSDIDKVYHEKWFAYLAGHLKPHIDHCVISILDDYKKLTKRLQHADIYMPSTHESEWILKSLSQIAIQNELRLKTCSEHIQIENVEPASCIDSEIIERISGRNVISKKDPNQRPHCGCIESVDIGVYNTCKNGCVYCYANFSDKSIHNKCKLHNPSSPLLIGMPDETDKIYETKKGSIFDETLSLFDLKT